MRVKIFISYRREDSIDIVGRIHEWLKIRLPPGCVFYDVESIRAGAAFPDVIEKVLIEEAEIVLVIIGLSWTAMSTNGEPGVRRLDLPNDTLRREIEIAIEHNKTIVPLLVQGSQMPQRQELPASITHLADRQALRIRPDPDFSDDMRRLRAELDKLSPNIGWGPPVQPPSGYQPLGQGSGDSPASGASVPPIDGPDNQRTEGSTTTDFDGKVMSWIRRRLRGG